MKHLLLSSFLLLSFSLVATTAKADETTRTPDEAKGEAKAEKVEKAAEPAKEAAAEAKSEGGAVTCKNGADVRTLTKTKPEGKACAVMYKKGDSETSVADANNDATHCDKVIDKMKGNLANSGFTCE